MKRNAGKMFISGFVKSILIVTALLSAGILSYKAAMHFWQPKEDSVVAYQEETLVESIPEASDGGISKNLIICYDDETKDIKKIVLEILNSNRKKLTYITIPQETQFTVSSILYRKMALTYPEIPQVMKLNTVSKYLDYKKAFDYEMLIVEDLLGIKINYYTAIPQSAFETIFSEKSVEQTDGYDSMPEEGFSKKYKEYLKTLNTEEKLGSYIEEIYPTFISNLVVEDKMSCLGSYYEALKSDISFDLIKGTNLNSAYVVDEGLAAEQLTELLNSGAD